MGRITPVLARFLFLSRNVCPVTRDPHTRRNTRMATPNKSKLIAQSIGVPVYALNLSTLVPRQIAYNGKCTYVALRGGYPPPAGWCHLLLLRGASRWLAVITQPADCGVSIVNTIEHIAS